MTPSFDHPESTARDLSLRPTHPGTSKRRAAWVYLLVLACTACSSSDPSPDRTPDDSGTGGSGGHDDLTGTGTECSPAEACVGESTGCTECPSTKLCIVNIVNGAGVNLGGASGESVTFLNHRCVELPSACDASACSCEESELCGHGDCVGSLPVEYDDIGNLVEVSEGGVFCSEYDG